jgi:putative FmdB family regulatory protein
MPIYEYQCNACGKVFEELLITSRDCVWCACGSNDLTKLMSRPAPARIQDLCLDQDTGRFRLDDATFHPSVKDPLAKVGKVYEMDFGKSEKRRLAEKSQMENV